MNGKRYKDAKAARKVLNGDVRRERAFGSYDKTAREAQRRASAYGRARGNS